MSWVEYVQPVFFSRIVELEDWHPPDFYGVGQKNWTCLSIDNSATVSSRKTRDTSKV